MNKLSTFVFALLAFLSGNAQQGFVHGTSADDGYVWPTDSAVAHKLNDWRDLKFGLLFHYGLYSLPGIVESWSICSEDVDWINRPHLELPYEDYKSWYWGLADSMKVSNFHPDQWAQMAQEAGAKYAILTTKHHDGFCLFNSRLTDFSLPAKGQPDVVDGFLNAFREKGLWVGTYFSKPDWHCPWFWNPQFATPNRRENYKRERHPQWWDNYTAFARNQLRELTGGRYGKIDILWLDGGWVEGDEIGLDSVLVEARSLNPGMLAVDRTIGGPNENYRTPERGIPDEIASSPWESCIPLSDDWGWVPNPRWKSPEKVIDMLADAVSKGGCLVLGVGPQADGSFQPEVVERLQAIGKWLNTYGQAIYATHPAPEFVPLTPNLHFTLSPDSSKVNLLYTPSEPPASAAEEVTLEWDGPATSGLFALAGGKKPLKGVAVETLPSGRRRLIIEASLLAAAPFALSAKL